MGNNEEKLGLVYHPDYLIHTQSQHPERKERLEHIVAAITEGDLLKRVEMFEPLPAKVEEIALIHDRRYISSVEESCLNGEYSLDLDTYIVPDSYRVALFSAGGALTGLRKIFEQSLRKVFVLNRPPGHHAEKNRAMGFCLFNNIAVAAAVARRDYGLERIAIVDWDVHHGNGTQHSFENDRAVLFISLHQSPAFPGTGNTQEVGRGDGEGFTVNIPLPAGSGDAEYKIFFEQVVVPILDAYKPELLLVSAGQDAYRHDPLAGMALTHQGYYNMASSLAGVAERWSKGRMLLCLEGGYHLKGQAGAVVQVLNALGNWGLPVTEDTPISIPGIFALERLQQVMAIQRRYWPL